MAIVLLPLAMAHAQDITMEASVFHGNMYMVGRLLPYHHNLDSNGVGGSLFASHTTGFFAGARGVYAYHQQHADDILGNTDLFLGFQRQYGALRFGAYHAYTHLFHGAGVSFLKDDIHETTAWVGVDASNILTPYFVTGIGRSAYIPVDKAVGFIGAGVESKIPVAQGITFTSDSMICASWFLLNREKEIFSKNRIAMMFEYTPDLPKLGVGLNLLQDIHRSAYKIWFDISLHSFAFWFN